MPKFLISTLYRIRQRPAGPYLCYDSEIHFTKGRTIQGFFIGKIAKPGTVPHGRGTQRFLFRSLIPLTCLVLVPVLLVATRTWQVQYRTCTSTAK